jgi:prolyl oligopeptidase
MQLSATQHDPVTEVLHGVRITDQFRWLEDRTSEATSAWIAAQKLRHDSYFAEMPGLEVLRARVSGYLNVDVLDQPGKVAGRFFYRRRRKDQEQGCICVQDTLDGQERVLVDPSALGPFASVGIHRISRDSALLAYQLKHGGSDAMEIHFVLTETGQQLPDSLPLGYARGLLFTSDGSGFFYCHEDLSRKEDHTIQLHEFGQKSNDSVLFRRGRTACSRLVLTGDDFRLGAIYRHEMDDELRTDLYCATPDLGSEWHLVFMNRAFPYEPFLHQGHFFVFTQEHAPNGKLIELSSDGTEMRTVVPEWVSRIDQYVCTDQAVYVRYLLERKSSVRAYALDGRWAETVPFPVDGTIQILPRLTSNPDSLFYSYESFHDPLAIYEYQPQRKASTLLARSGSPSSRNAFGVEEHWFLSYDGAKIPMFLVRRSDLDPTVPHPMVMTGYGGFGVSMTPKFSVLVTLLVELGAVFALPCIRGGSELGKEWHEAARRTKRQVAISDFIAAAEWLSHWHSSSPSQIGIFGGSNSGLLVAAAMTQRPDLFRAVLSIAPLLDMVRYELFDNARKWIEEYGTVEDREDFAALHGYSPYHHVAEEVDYPATLFVAGDGDDRCNPAHVRKMAARLQERSAQRQPILVDYSAERGHSPALPLSVRTDALTRRIAFLCKELSIPLRAGGLA